MQSFLFIERELVIKKKWIDEKEILDIIAVSETTPGPIAVNTATFIGSRIAGFWGALAWDAWSRTAFVCYYNGSCSIYEIHKG